MEKEYAIQVNNVCKSFKIYQDKGNMLKERALHWNRNKYEKKKVLDDVSFCVKRGEAVGLIGCNGSGKSTTLKLLTGIIYPDSGTIQTNGRISSLLELGAGFHPDLSGKENIYINASIFGLNRKEIDKKFAEIVKFSELENYIDNPVRTYSSGMYMKLAFSVAINVDAEILLIDEILAVGDVNFQSKCFKKMQDIKNKGTTIVLVSHSMEQIEKICDRSIWLLDGKIREDGGVKEVNFKYLAYMNQLRRIQIENEAVEIELKSDKEEKESDEVEQLNNKEEWGGRFGSGEIKIGNIRCLNSKGQSVNTLDFGETFTIEFTVENKRDLKDVWFGISIIRNDGVVCYGTNTIVEDYGRYTVSKSGKVSILFKNIKLLPGIFYIDVCIGKDDNEFVDYWQSAKTIEIFDNRHDIGLVKLENEWQIMI